MSTGFGNASIGVLKMDTCSSYATVGDDHNRFDCEREKEW
jgi:hypothetical protein